MFLDSGNILLTTHSTHRVGWFMVEKIPKLLVESLERGHWPGHPSCHPPTCVTHDPEGSCDTNSH